MSTSCVDNNGTNNAVGSGRRIQVLDYIRAMAIIHVFIYHYFMEWFNASFMVVPEGIVNNLDRLQVFKDGGLFGLVKNLASFLLVYGFSAVNIFLVVSGFVLALGWLKKETKENLLYFYWRKYKRILVPFYASLLLGVGMFFLRNFLFPSEGGPPIFSLLDGLKMLFVPFLVYDIELLQKFNGDYWFVPLILQMYLLFPLLIFLLKKMGPWKFLLMIFVVSIGYRLYASYYLDTVPIGVYFETKNSYRLMVFALPRLFEFGFGMALGYWYAKGVDVLAYLGRARFLLAGLILGYGGFVLRMYRPGWAFCDMLMGVGLFPVLLFAVNWISHFWKGGEKVLKKVGKVSYPIYLLHHYFLNYLFLPLLSVAGLRGNEWAFWLLIIPYSAVCIWLGELANWLGKAFSDVFKWLGQANPVERWKRVLESIRVRN